MVLPPPPPMTTSSLPSPASIPPLSSPQPTDVAPPPPNPGLAELVMHKNRLQEYAQKSSLPLPLYQTVNEGYPHTPQFRSTVTVDGVTFRSHHTFRHRKEAEQDVAKLALEGLTEKVKTEDVALIYKDTAVCKSILHEFAAKMNIRIPAYTTSRGEGILPIFTSSLVFDGETYTGGFGKNKKEAEHIAARTVIETILANSSKRSLMSQIILSKERLHAAVHNGSTSGCLRQKRLASNRPSENSSGNIKGKEVQHNLTNANLLNNHIAYSESAQSANAANTFPLEANTPGKEYICKPVSVELELGSQDGVLDNGTKHADVDQGGHESKKARTDD